MKKKSVTKTVNTVAAASEQSAADPQKAKRLQENETIIAKAQSSFLDIGKALQAIRDGKLFDSTKHDSFEAYCIKQWSYSQSYANRLIAAHNCHELLKKELSASGEVLPGNEYQLRALIGLPEAEWVAAWKQVLASAAGKPVTGEMVEAVVGKKLGKAEAAKPEGTAADPDAAAATDKPETNKQLVKIGKLVTKALEKFSKLSHEEIAELLKEIQTLAAE